MENKRKYKNIYPAISVPLNDDYSINEKELREYVSWLASIDGIDGLVTNGHTGEITSFNREERKKVTEIVADEVGDKVKIISGVSCEGTIEAKEHAADAQDAGADGILLMPPHSWLRFGMSEDSPLEFFKDVASAIDIDIIIHLYPYGTKAFYPVETIIEMSKIENVKCLKMGTRDFAVYERDLNILRKEVPELSILTCHDEYLLSSMYPGVDGALIGFGGCIPEIITEAWEYVKEENLTKAKQIQKKILPMAAAIYGIGQPSGEAHARLKYTLYKRGIFSSPLMRKPVLPIKENEQQTVENVLMEIGLLD